jgi:hypothetical protein
VWLFPYPINGVQCPVIANLNADKLIGVSGGSTAEGAPVILWSFIVGHPDQLWCPATAPN